MTETVMDAAKSLHARVSCRPSEPQSTAAMLLGVPALCAGAALAAYKGAKLAPSFTLIFGTFGLVALANGFCSDENGESTVVRAFTTGFVTAGVFQYCLL